MQNKKLDHLSLVGYISRDIGPHPSIILINRLILIHQNIILIKTLTGSRIYMLHESQVKHNNPATVILASTYNLPLLSNHCGLGNEILESTENSPELTIISIQLF